MSTFKVKNNKTLYFLSYAGFWAVAKFVLILPKGFARRLGIFMARLAFRVDIRHRRLAVYNLTLAYGGEKSIAEIRAMARQVYRNLGVMFVDFLQAPKLTRENVDEHFEFEGIENLDEAARLGRGIIAFSGHLGNWELIIGHTLKMGTGKESTVVKRIGNPYIDEFICNQREKLGGKLIPTRRTAGEILKRLKRGEFVVFVVDQRAKRQEGIFVKFFSIPALTNIAPALMAIKTGAVLLPVFVIRLPDGRHRIIYGKPMEPISTGDRKQDIIDNTKIITKCVEDMIRKYPEQWFWVHSRWKTIPEPDEEVW